MGRGGEDCGRDVKDTNNKKERKEQKGWGATPSIALEVLYIMMDSVKILSLPCEMELSLLVY